MAYEAKIIADSICEGQRLTTMQLTHPRIVHAEFMTHCMFARNASSSRAIPFNVTVQKVADDPFVPVWWGENQKGMQAAKEIAEWKKERAINKWLQARDIMIKIAKEMADPDCSVCKGEGKWYTETIKDYVTCLNCHGTGEGLNIHKQIVNRLLEPWSWITVAATGDWSAWSNYFALRCDKDAQPEIAKQAYMAQLAYFRSKPRELKVGEWHLPYVGENEFPDLLQSDVAKISVGRCARTSYLTQEWKREPAKDVELFDRLYYHEPKHASPFEHVCEAMGNKERYAKYTGWRSYRFGMPREYITDFKPNHPELVDV